MYLDMAGLRTLFSYCKHRQIKYVWPWHCLFCHHPNWESSFCKRSSRCQTAWHILLKEKSKSLCVNNCVINKSSYFSKLLTFWVELLPGVICLSSANLQKERSGPPWSDRGDAAHAFVSHLGKSVVTLCVYLCIMCVQVGVCCSKEMNFIFVINFNTPIY